MKKSLWLYPGQGSQNQQMLATVSNDYFELVNKICGKDYRITPPNFTQTVDIQMTILLTQMSTTDALRQSGLLPDMVAGHSLGAFSAAYAIEMFNAEEMIKLVFKRSSMMQNLYPEGYGMGVIVGLTKQEVHQLVDEYFSPEAPIYVSNQNEELQLTISGSWIGIDKVLIAAKSLNASKAIRLSVPTPSHSILMKPVTEALTNLVQNMTIDDPKCPYLSNCTGRLLTQKNEIVQDLVENVIYPVRWLDMMQVAVENYMMHFIELPPGSTLTHLIKRSYPNAFTYNVEQYGISDTVFLYNKRSKEV